MKRYQSSDQISEGVGADWRRETEALASLYSSRLERYNRIKPNTNGQLDRQHIMTVTRKLAGSNEIDEAEVSTPGTRAMTDE